ncbi:MAG: hypothetical protein V4558_05025 [Gemmatimonadota bacterium]
MRHAAVAAALAGLSLTTPLIANAQLSRPKIDTVGGHVVRVMNPGPTAWVDTNGWKLVLERTIQPKDGEPGELENPTGVILLRDGRTVVYQRAPARLRLYDAQGRFVRDISREGEGPGEIRRPLVGVYGDTVVAFDAGRGRATLLTLEGKRVREFLTNTHADGPPISLDARGRLRVERGRIVGDAVRKEWFYFDPVGKQLDSIVPPEAGPYKGWVVKSNGGIGTYGIPLAANTQYAFRNDGTILYGAWDRYAFVLSRHGADTTLIFGRSGVAPTPISSGLRDSLFTLSTGNPEVAAIASKRDIPTSFPLWNDAAFDGSGNLWVSAGLARLRNLHFDLFSPAGRYLGAVPAPFASAARASWSTDRVAVIDTDDNDLPRVRIYRIDRRGK